MADSKLPPDFTFTIEFTMLTGGDQEMEDLASDMETKIVDAIEAHAKWVDTFCYKYNIDYRDWNNGKRRVGSSQT